MLVVNQMINNLQDMEWLLMLLTPRTEKKIVDYMERPTHGPGIGIR